MPKPEVKKIAAFLKDPLTGERHPAPAHWEAHFDDGKRSIVVDVRDGTVTISSNEVLAIRPVASNIFRVVFA